MLVGECNRCGLCCQMGAYRCVNLIVRGKLGGPEATSCAVYATRYDRMPITMVDEKGNILPGKFMCSKDSPDEEKGIRERGIGRGCSLTEV